MSTHRVVTPTQIGDNAVVIGASMAGLCAARVLADRFDQVTVVDRDTLPDAPTWRNQVPQGRHPHLLLASGARLLEGWFPGIVDELYAGGAVEIDLAADIHWYQGGGVARRPPSSLRGPAMSRPFLEWIGPHAARRAVQRHHPRRHQHRRPRPRPHRAASHRRPPRRRPPPPLRPPRRRQRPPRPQPCLARTTRLPITATCHESRSTPAT